MSTKLKIAGILFFALVFALVTGYSAQAYTEQERLTERQIEAKKSLLATYENLLTIQKQKLYLLERLNGDTRKFQTMVAIAEAESGFDQGAKNKRTGDHCIFQVNKKTWDITAKKMGLDYENSWKDCIDLSLHILEVQGLSAWNASKGKWSKTLARLKL